MNPSFVSLTDRTLDTESKKVEESSFLFPCNVIQLLSATVQAQVKLTLNPRSSLHHKSSTGMARKCPVCAVAEAWGKKERRSMTKEGSIAEGQNILVEIKKYFRV